MPLLHLHDATLSPYIWVFSSCICFIIASVGAHWFGTSQLVTGAWPWSTNGGYNTGEFFGLVLHTYFTPLAIICFMVGTPLIAKNPNINMRRIELSCILIALFSAMWVAWVNGAKAILDCGVVFCFYKGSDDDGYSSYSFDPFKTIFNAINFMICLYFMLITLPMLFPFMKSLTRLCYGQCTEEEEGNMEKTGEITPLLNSQGSSNDSDSVHKSSMQKYKLGTSKKQYAYLLAMFVFFFPLFLFFASILPDLWLYFSLSGIQSLGFSPETDDDLTAGPVISFKTSETDGSFVYAKFWPDLLLFYGFIYLSSGVAMLCSVSNKLRLFMRSKPSFSPYGYCMGTLLFALFLGGMLLSLYFYWYYGHGFDYSSKSSMSDVQRAARSLGQVQNAVLGLLLFPTARTSIWPHVFGVSWEAGIALHIVLGYLFLILVALHALLWYVYYAKEGWFPHDIFAIQLDNTEWPSDFSVDLISLVMLVTFITHGILALNWFRRQKFEVFYYAHFSFLALILATLWHAPSAWYYLLPGIALYMTDHAVRFSTQSKIIKVSELKFENGIIHLGYQIEVSRGRRQDNDNNNAANFKPLRHTMAQYVFLNIPELSLLEWHPFTISSAPGDDVTTHHIRKMAQDGQTDTFTARLECLASEYTHKQLPPSSLNISIEGPYGLEVDYSKYEAVLFIGGGIGVTPLHSSFRGLMKLRKASTSTTGPLPSSQCLSSVHLLWSARKPALFEMFGETWRECLAMPDIEADSCNDGDGEEGDRQFRFSFYADEAGVDEVCDFPYTKGRPDFRNEISHFGRKYGKRGLVFVCHVPPVMAIVAELSREFGAELHSETFEL